MMSAAPPLSATLPDRLDGKIELAIEAVRLDDVELPGERAGPLHCETNAIGGGGISRRRERHNECERERSSGKHP